MDDILDYADRHLEETIARLQAFCRQPSIAAQGEGMEEMAKLVLGSLQKAGGSAELVPTPGYPVVLGRFAGAGSRTLMFYNHYDVQPPDPLDQWQTPPFEPVVRDGYIYGRGASDDKGQLLAHVKAAEAFVRVQGGPPLEIIFFCYSFCH